jgi:hypothetical protein
MFHQIALGPTRTNVAFVLIFSGTLRKLHSFETNANFFHGRLNKQQGLLHLQKQKTRLEFSKHVTQRTILEIQENV